MGALLSSPCISFTAIKDETIYEPWGGGGGGGGGGAPHWSLFQLNLHRQWYILGLISVAKGIFGCVPYPGVRNSQARLTIHAVEKMTGVLVFVAIDVV